MTQLTAQDQRWAPVRDSQKNAVVAAILASVDRGDAVTIADLAEHAGMSRPTFYKYFPTLGAAMLHTHRTLLAAMQQYVSEHLPDSSRPALDRLLASFDLSFEYTREHREVLRFFSFFDFSFRRFGLSVEEHEELARIVADSGDHTQDLLIEGQSDGSIHPDLPIEQTVMAVSGSVLGLAQRLLIQDEYASDDDDERARAAHALVLDAWRVKLRP
jgi:AcrR family transcriptional regulator